MTLVHFAIINLGSLIAATGGILLKRLSEQLDHNLPLMDLALYTVKSPFLWIGGFCYVFPILLWIYLLKYIELTKLQPLLSIVYLYTIILAMIFLDEMLSIAQLFGIVLIVTGSIFMVRS